MPKFRFTAIDEKGKVERSTIIAHSDADVEEKLLGRGLTLIKLTPAKESAAAGFFIRRAVKTRDLIEFYHRLSQTLALGLPIISALEENEKIISAPYLKRVIEEIRIGIESGNTLHQAMRRFPKVFMPLDLAVVRLGESSGILPRSLEELAEFLEWREDIRSTIKRAAIYPTFIIAAILAVIGVWVGYVLPQMTQLLVEMGVSIPGVTLTVLRISHFVRSTWPLLLGVFMALASLFYLYQKTDRGRLVVHRLLLKIPVLGRILHNIALTRLSHNFATMYDAGINISGIFDILSDKVLGNRYLEKQLRKVYEEVQHGESIADGMQAAEGFPTLLVGAVRNGETTGTIDDAFRRLGKFYDGEVKKSVQALINVMEPLSIAFLGGVFGLIALSIMLPLYDVIADFK